MCQESNLHVVWLDLTNAYGSVPHKLIEFTLCQACTINIIAKYFSNLRMCFLVDGQTTGWQKLEVSIAMGSSISLILLVTAFKVILIGARQIYRGLISPSGGRLPVLREYVDDVTTMLQTAPCTARLFKCLDELIQWARLIKAAKWRSLSIRKEVRDDMTVFTVGGKMIPLLKEQPVRTLG